MRRRRYPYRDTRLTTNLPWYMARGWTLLGSIVVGPRVWWKVAK